MITLTSDTIKRLSLYFIQIFLGLISDNKNELFAKNIFSIRRKLRAAHPLADVLLFYATKQTCLQFHCGYDVYLLEYLAEKLNMEIM